MQSDKTHEQQLRIIQKRENTANGDPEFDIEADLKRSDELKEAMRKGQDLQARSDITDDDLSIVRGMNQESRHHKGSGQN